jgi:dTDP-4-amino-4,6-dideoxygalactose transaminase
MIPFFDYRPELGAIAGEIDAAVSRVLSSGRLILGPEVEAFEREFSTWVGARHAVGVACGTDAIALALRALGIGAGDEVLTVANAGAPPVAGIRAAGGVPRFVDVDAESLLIDPGLLEQARTQRTRCVLPVHLYGRAVPMEPILEFAARHGLAVVEDCAQAHGARPAGRHVGTRGAIGCFSFYPTKNLGALGDAGACVTDDPALAARLRRLRMYGFDGDRTSHIEGVNSRLDELQAAVLRVKLRHLDALVSRRRSLARAYGDALRDSAIRCPDAPAPDAHAWHLFVVRPENRDAAIAALDRRSIGFGIHYPCPVHRMEAYEFLGYRTGDLPVTEGACDSVLSLPLYPGLDDRAVPIVAAALRGTG